jgi:thiamine transport system ATP-binding protein
VGATRDAAGGLAVRDLTVRFDGADAPAVDRVGLDLPTGHVLSVLGPSGSGKSTLLRAVAGLERLESGSVSYAGQDLAGVPVHRRGFALMFQDGQLFPHRTVAGNVGYALRLRGIRSRAVAHRVEELLELVGLPGFGARSTTSLSGGERQRVALARSLAVEPRLLLLDEPLSALDRGLRERLAHDLRDILVAAGTTALLVTHDQEEAFAVADRMALMRAGRLVQEGTVEEVWRAPVDAEAARFLGYATVLDGPAARRVLEAGGAGAGPSGVPVLALRRSALKVAPAGSRCGPLAGRVLSARLTPDAVRLTVEVEGVGEVHAVGDLDADLPAVGNAVHLVLDLTRAARLDGSGTVGGTP